MLFSSLRENREKQFLTELQFRKAKFLCRILCGPLGTYVHRMIALKTYGIKAQGPSTTGVVPCYYERMQE